MVMNAAIKYKRSTRCETYPHIKQRYAKHSSDANNHRFEKHQTSEHMLAVCQYVQDVEGCLIALWLLNLSTQYFNIQDQVTMAAQNAAIVTWPALVA